MSYGKRSPQPLEIELGPLPMTSEGLMSECRYLAHVALRQRLLDGTASSQERLYALNVDPELEALKKDEVRSRVHKLETQVKYIDAQANSDQIAKEAVEAFKSYQSSYGGPL